MIKLTETSVLSIARAAARELSAMVLTDTQIVTMCLGLLSGETIGPVKELARRIHGLSVNEQHYWIGTLYTLLLSPEVRRAQAAYFTPPNLAEAVIDIVIDQGFDLDRHDVLDPSAGGAAFLSLIAHRMKRGGLPPQDIARRLNGIEIDHRLARISEELISSRLNGYRGRKIITFGDALRITPDASYDLVIANPPYGRISAADLPEDYWKRIAHSGHINKYAVFAEYCFRRAKPKALVALVIPSSFRAGPFYDRMREFVRANGQVLVLGSVAGRNDVFADVAQDVSVLVVRKGEPHQWSRPVSFPVFKPNAVVSGLSSRLPRESSSPWQLPTAGGRRRGGATFLDYGASVKAGYFVWNREPHRLFPHVAEGAYPLIWAKNIRPGKPCFPEGKKGMGVDFVQVPAGSSAIVSCPAVVVQRTINNKQSRVLNASYVDESVVREWGGFVSENHTIVITAQDPEMIFLLSKLLNTRAIDARYRDVSGTASISVKLLRDLDLPMPEDFRAALQATGDPELAAEHAFGAERYLKVAGPAR